MRLTFITPGGSLVAEEAHSHLSLAEVGTEEFLQKLTSQITEMVSAKISQGEVLVHVSRGRWGQVLLSGGRGSLVSKIWKLSGYWGLGVHHNLCAHPAKLQVPGGDSDEESKTPSASPRHGRSRPSSSVQESSSESEDGDSRGEVGGPWGTRRGGGSWKTM